MDRLRALFDRRRDHALGRPSHEVGRPSAPIPAVIAARLIPDNVDEPLFPKFKGYGKGRPGVTQEREVWWVIQDERGRVVGGAVVASIGPGHPVSIDVAIDPARQGQGLGTALYAALEAAGIDMDLVGKIESGDEFRAPAPAWPEVRWRVARAEHNRDLRHASSRWGRQPGHVRRVGRHHARLP